MEDKTAEQLIAALPDIKPNENGRCAAPVSGVVKSIRFDPGRHEFVLALEPRD